MKNVLTPAQMREADQYTIDMLGVPACVLMERAAMAVVSHLPSKGRVLVLCGTGNNGADGFAVARILHNRFRAVTCFFSDEENLRGDALLQHDMAQRMGVPLESEWGRFPALLADCEAVVDALFGTGLSRDLRWPYDEAAAQVNAAGKYVVAVDIPSGVHGGTGHIMGQAIHADVTVTFQFAKAGCLLLPGREYTGKLAVEDIGIPQGLGEGSALCWLEQADIPHLPRTMAGNKTSYGHAAVLAGSVGMTGAGALCAQAALRAGAGLVSWGVPAAAQSTAAAYAREIMTCPLPDEDGQFSPDAAEKAAAFLNGKKALALGPGLGRGAASAFVAQLAGCISCP
ncbi:MAG: NAD(P)H-hydrate epimerase, partial [Eubacteriales bacterium]|nr:NAD(P)H-hydrate epimerase [Eubacteriales bacterium]